MKRVWPIIAVSDVPASAQWYMNLLGAQQTHPGSTAFDQIVDDDGAPCPVGVPGRVARKDGKRIDSLDHIHVSDPVIVHLKDIIKRVKHLEGGEDNGEPMI